MFPPALLRSSRKLFVKKGNSLGSLGKPKPGFLILGWKCSHYCLFYADIFIQFLDLEILSDLVCESLCYYRHNPDSDLLEEPKRLLPSLFISR